MKVRKFEYYYRLIGKDKAKDALEQLLNQYPNYQKDLILMKSRFASNQKKLYDGLQNSKDFEVEKNNLNVALVALLDNIEQPEMELKPSSPISTLLENQMEYIDNTIKENKTFRTAVGLLFLVAITSTAFVGIQHIRFLSEELHIIQVLLVNFFLYFIIGILAFYALSLVIKGSSTNKEKLKFFKQILKK